MNISTIKGFAQALATCLILFYTNALIGQIPQPSYTIISNGEYRIIHKEGVEDYLGDFSFKRDTQKPISKRRDQLEIYSFPTNAILISDSDSLEIEFIYSADGIQNSTSWTLKRNVKHSLDLLVEPRLSSVQKLFFRIKNIYKSTTRTGNIKGRSNSTLIRTGELPEDAFIVASSYVSDTLVFLQPNSISINFQTELSTVMMSMSNTQGSLLNSISTAGTHHEGEQLFHYTLPSNSKLFSSLQRGNWYQFIINSTNESVDYSYPFMIYIPLEDEVKMIKK